MYKFQLYIDGEKIDLFKDETISLNSTVKNVRDVSKVFTDFTQSFTIPASPMNNSIFSHWYNVDISGGFNANSTVEAIIELNFIPFKSGVVRLESVSMRKGKPYNYKITFLGHLASLGQLFGDDKISVLDLTPLNHVQSYNNVLSGVTSLDLKSGEVIYPLISTDKYWVWGGLGTHDIKADAANTNSIAYDSLKPAIKVSQIIDAIEVKYGITFSNDFFGDTHFGNLWIWCNNSKDSLQTTSNGSIMLLDLDSTTGVGWSTTTNDYTTQTTGDDQISVTIDVSLRDVDVDYTVYLYLDGVLQSSQTSSGDDTLDMFTNSTAIGEKITIGISYDNQLNYQANVSRTLPAAPANDADTNTAFAAVFVNNALPDITVTSFLDGIFKMFNLAIIPNTSTDFFVDTLDSWYANGTNVDVTKYIDLEKSEVVNQRLTKEVEFKYTEGESLLATGYKDANNGIGYGDLVNDFAEGLGSMKIELPFENFMWSNLSDVGTGADADIHVSFSVDIDDNPVLPAPVLFYRRDGGGADGMDTAATDYQISDESATIDRTQDKFHNIGQEDNITTGSTTQSLNFGAEISTWNRELQTESLYSNYWETYISDLYDSKRRIFDFKAPLPLSVITTLNLNDAIIIGERSYITNNMNTNFTTGETKLNMLNYIGVLTGIATYILDLYPSSNAAYSLRKLKDTSVNAVEIRRSSDNATTDVILENAGSITLSSTVSAGGTLGTWIGANTAYVKTWYDQSGGSADLIQTTDANQPILITTGTLETSNGNAAIFVNSTRFMLSTNITADIRTSSSIGVMEKTAAANNLSIGLTRYSTTNNYNRMEINSSTDAMFGQRTDVYPFIISAVSLNTQYLITGIARSDSDREAYLNGTSFGSNTTTIASDTLVNEVYLNKVHSTYTALSEGYVSEFIYYDSDKSSDRTLIEANINNHYSIY